MLVRMALKSRWWWCKGSWDDLNYVWMQLKSKRAMEMIKSNLKESSPKTVDTKGSTTTTAAEISDSETLSTKANTEIDGGLSTS